VGLYSFSEGLTREPEDAHGRTSTVTVKSAEDIARALTVRAIIAMLRDEPLFLQPSKR
jgi:hypothetical protein